MHSPVQHLNDLFTNSIQYPSSLDQMHMKLFYRFSKKIFCRIYTQLTQIVQRDMELTLDRVPRRSAALPNKPERELHACSCSATSTSCT